MPARSSPRTALRPGVALLLGLALGGYPAPVGAASASETAGLSRFEEGKKAFEAGQFEPALKAFQESLSLLPSPNTRLYIGRCFRALGKSASAFTALRLSAREASDRLNATGEKRFGATRDWASSEAAELEPKVPRLTVAVPSDVPEGGSSVQVDGVELPRAAWGAAVETDPGAHTVSASGPRRRPFSVAFSLGNGEQKRVDVALPRLPTGVVALSFKTRPGGMTIEFDGKAQDLSGWAQPRELDAGPHQLVVKAPGFSFFRWSGQLADGDRAEIEVALAPQEPAPLAGGGTPRWIFFGAAGAGVASLAIGSGLAFAAKSKSSAETAKDPLQRDPAERDRVRSLSTDANVFFIAGGLLALGAGVLAFTTDWGGAAAQPETIGIAPLVSPGFGGVAAAGRF